MGRDMENPLTVSWHVLIRFDIRIPIRVRRRETMFEFCWLVWDRCIGIWESATRGDERNTSSEHEPCYEPERRARGEGTLYNRWLNQPKAYHTRSTTENVNVAFIWDRIVFSELDWILRLRFRFTILSLAASWGRVCPVVSTCRRPRRRFWYRALGSRCRRRGAAVKHEMWVR